MRKSSAIRCSNGQRPRTALETRRRARPSAEDGVDEWFDASGNSSSERMADQLDTSLENVFPDEPGLAALSASGPSSSGPTDAGFDNFDFAPGKPDLRQHVREQIALSIRAPEDRFIARRDCRRARRGRLYARRSRRDRRTARRLMRPMPSACLAFAKASTRRDFSRATFPNALRCNWPHATGSTRPWKRWSPISTSWRGAISRR